MIVFLMVALFGLSSAQDEETKLSLLNMFTSSIIGKVFDSRKVGEEDGKIERAVFSNPFLNRPVNAPPKWSNLFGLQGDNKFQLFKKKVQTTLKPAQYVKYPRISSAIEKFKQPVKSQLSPVIPQIVAPQIVVPQYQESLQYYNHYQTAPALPYF